MIKKLKKIISKKWVYIPLIVVVSLIAGIVLSHGSQDEDYVTQAASRGDFVQVIPATGKVVSAKNVDLSFESAGKVAKVSVEVGDQVKTGQSLASLSSGDAYGNLLGAQARLETEQIRLRSLQSGNRPEEVQIKETALSNARVARDQSEKSLKDDIINSFVTADDLVKNKLNPIFYSDPNSEHEDINTNDYNLKQTLDKEKDDFDYTLKNWEKSIQALQSGSYSSSYLNEALTNLSLLRDLLNGVAIAVSTMSPDQSNTQSDIDKFKSDVSTSRASVNSSIATLTAGKDALTTADLAIKTAEDNLNLSQAGANPFDVQTQMAVVKSAQAAVVEASATLGKSQITAPFDGLITKVNVTAGESASPSAPSISLISAANFEIESFIPEADISKIHLNDKAQVTLDAYGSATFFDAVITKIDPAETVIDDVSTYKATFQFTQKDDRIKSGMTANIDIQGQVRPNVLSVPQSALLYDKDNNKTVYILKDGEKKPEPRSVRTGQTDDKGNVEIVDGVTEGEKVVTNPPRT